MTKNRKLVYVFLAALIVILAIAGFFVWQKYGSGRKQANSFALYSNPDFGISLSYPGDWTPDQNRGEFKNIPLSYKGVGGFFGIDAVSGPVGIKLEDAVKALASDVGKPYGSSPTFSTTTVAGSEAELILPSSDQAPAKNGESAIVVRYPKPVHIGDHDYFFIMIYGDEAHLGDIATTLNFTGL